MNALESIKQQLREFEQKKKEIVEQLREEFPKILMPIFEKTDKIDNISWTQYTPWFNDGDTCEFSVNLDIKVNGKYADDLDWYDWKVVEYVNEGKYVEDVRKHSEWDQVACMAVHAFRESLETIPEEFYFDLFGDHVQVTCHRDGTIKVEEYEHD